MNAILPTFGEARPGFGKALLIGRLDGVAKSPPYGVTAIFQDLDILDVCLRP
jgi:hypothetical protein